MAPIIVVRKTDSAASAERGASPVSETWKIGPRAMIGSELI